MGATNKLKCEEDSAAVARKETERSRIEPGGGVVGGSSAAQVAV